MTKIKSIFSLIILLIFFFSCKEEMNKYDRPDWLAGKVYTQILDQPELSTFASCIEKTGYDKVLDISGSYTVFAPSNDAFNKYFTENTAYSSVDDIPLAVLEELIKYHVVQNPWSKIQLRSLDVFGWIDTLDLNNNEPKGFKRETLFREPNRKYGWDTYVKNSKTSPLLVDTLSASRFRRVLTDSRKYVPVFYQEYFNIYDLQKEDYSFYFDRPFDSSDDIYFAGAKIVSEEISAENGFVYIIDRVVEPLKNAYELLEETRSGRSYSDFLEIINLYPNFEYDREATFDQPGADQGLDVDSLFNLSFPQLTFDVTSERTSAPRGTYGLPSNVTIRYHHGLMAPTNEAFQNFVNEYIKIPNGWGSFSGTPDVIKKIVANSYMSVNTIYPTDFEKGFYNGEKDLVYLDASNIVDHEFGSNSTFIGLNKAIVPRAFKSVTGPVYLRQGYNKVMLAIEQAGLLPALKRPNQDYMLFIESDANTSADSSLTYNSITERFSVFQVFQGGYQELIVDPNDLRTLLLNHVAVKAATGIPRKEFIPNLAGNYIVVNNETGEVSGTGKTTIGFRGTELAPDFPSVLSNTADNGTTFSINNWFSFSSPSLYTKISAEFPRFHNLLNKAGLVNTREYRYNFISDNEFYTVFVPTNAALDSANVDDLPVSELRNMLLLHFVQGSMIFTDGQQTAQYYETARIDEKSTQFTTVYTKIFIDPGIDVIQIPAGNGSLYMEVNEAEGITNIMSGVTGGTGQEVFPVLYVNAVLHQIDKVLNVTELDTN